MKRATIALMVLGLGLLLYGCGARQESTTYYYSPTWTRTGGLLLIKGLSTVERDIIGTQTGSSYYESLIAMSAAGSGESFLVDMTGAPPYAMSCSPTGEYVAYLGGLSNGVFSKIFIRNVSPTAPHQGLEQGEFLFYPGVKSFDWSPDGLQIVYCTSTEVRIRDWNDYTGVSDKLVVAEDDLFYVSWKYGTKIAFNYLDNTGATRLGLVNANGTGRNNLSVAASVARPQISAANNNLVYGLAGGTYCRVDVSAGTPVTTEVWNNTQGIFRGNSPRLSSTGLLAIYDKTPYETSGIYRLNLADGRETKIK